MQYRELGRSGSQLSVIGFGGIVLCGMEPSECDRAVAGALERGVSYFDVAPSYFDGEAEEKLGHALRGRRDEVFLACKTGKRDAQGARAELEQSLRRLQTDRFDLYQLHAMTSAEDVEAVFAPGGAMEVFEEAKQEGKVRLLGFSAHGAEAAVELLRRFSFDSVLFPFNFATFHHGFGPQVIEAAQQAGAGLLALKGMARTHWPKDVPGEARAWHKPWYQPIDDHETACLALRWTLSLPITSALPPGEVVLQEMALQVASDPTPLSAEEEEQVRALAEQTEPLFRVAA
jgi:aryl-alcohol dehydrogenase-like predicted oxidoreductase